MSDKEQVEHCESLQDGKLYVFPRSGIYQARVYKGDRRYVYRSLKTRSIAKARERAIKFFYEVEIKLEEGLPVQQKSFAEVIKEYVALRQRQYDRAQQDVINTSKQEQTSIYMLRQIKRVVKFWIEYCGKKAIDKIDNAVLQEYIAWRKDYYLRLPKDQIPKNARLNPADKTLEWETTLAKTILKYAQERGYRGAVPLPTWRYKAEKKIVRPAFTLPEYKRLYEGMRRWIRETDNKERRYTRELLRDYVLLLANSGMRVGEANNLRDSDVIEFKDELGRKNYMFNVKGKTGKRVVIPRTNAVRYVERVRRRNAEWEAVWSANANKTRRKKIKGDWFFRMPDGNKVLTLIDQFQVLLEYVGLTTNADGERFTLYSLRHFYAVQMLHKSKATVWDIARNMGTSVQVIESYYGRQATPLLLATKLGGG
ncbi:MAG TPA: hypothetical protein PKZ35_09870 [Gammaproteobacteria bacterium]|nr:hypothetical protein [Gammaproteobacteria bacterium]